jgi:hypothetical protein
LLCVRQREKAGQREMKIEGGLKRERERETGTEREKQRKGLREKREKEG